MKREGSKGKGGGGRREGEGGRGREESLHEEGGE